MQRLAVEAPLAGKHQVSLLHEVVEVRGVEHGLRAHLQLRAKERHHARAHAASRAATGQVEHVGSQVALHDGGQVRQASVEHAHLLGSRALLRAKDGGGAGHAAQGVVDVAHGDDLDIADARVHARDVDARDVGKRAAHRQELRAGSVVELDAARRSHAHATLVGAAAAQAHDDLLGTMVERVEQKLAHAKGRGLVSPAILPNKGKTSGGGHLDDSRAVLEHAVKALHRLAIRTAYLAGDALAGIGGQEGVYRSLAAVGHRDRVDMHLGKTLLQRLGHDTAHVDGAHGALKGVGHDQEVLVQRRHPFDKKQKRGPRMCA